MRRYLVAGVFIVSIVIIGAWLPSFASDPATNNEILLAQSDANKNDRIQKAGQAGDDESQPQTGGPKIFLPEEMHDFGTVTQGSKLTHKFKIQNVGDAPLKLIKAKGS